jgi:hypothetical protein
LAVEHGREVGIDHWCYAPESNVGDVAGVEVGDAVGGGHSEHALALEQRPEPECAPPVDAGSSWAAGSASSAVKRDFAPDQTRLTRLVFGDCSLADVSADVPARWSQALDAVPSACRCYAVSLSGRVPGARRLGGPCSLAPAVVDVTDVTAGAARDPYGCRPWLLLDSSLEATLRLQSTQPSPNLFDNQSTRRTSVAPQASGQQSWQVARLTQETAASEGDEATMVKRMGVSERL